MSILLQDLKYGVRMLLRTPVVSAVAALSLALGIAANATTFSIADGFLFSPLPYPDQSELVLMREGRVGESIELSPGVSIPNYRDYVAASESFESAFAYAVETANLTQEDTPEQLQIVVATPEIFEVLGVQPSLGRGFRAEEGAEGLGNVVVLHHDFWQRRYLAAPEVLGRQVTLDGEQFTVVGVMPEGFDMVPADIQAIRPSDFANQSEQRGRNAYLGMARLRDGVTIEQAQLELAPTSSRLEAEFPEAKRGRQLALVRMMHFFPGRTDRLLIQILTLVTLFGLLIACANVANLLLGRAEMRQKEVSVRIALGAGRGRVFRQLLTESVMLGLAAGLAGVGMAVYLVKWTALAMPPQMPASMFPRLSWGVLMATVLVSILAGVAFGLAPAVHASRGDLREALGEGSRGGTASRKRKRLRNVFVVGEFAAALALLTGSAFMIQAFSRLTTGDQGFVADGLLTFQVSALEDRYAAPEELRVYQRELVDALQEIPGVEGVAVMSSLPRGQSNPRTRYTVTGLPVPELEEQPTADLQSVNQGYFETMAIEIRQGRGFLESDGAEAQAVALVSESLARAAFPGEDPLGRSLTIADEPRVIVGVVEDILQDRIALAGRGAEQIYLHMAQSPRLAASFAVRAAGDPSELSADVRRAVWSVEPDQPVAAVQTLQASIDASLAGPRTIQTFLIVLAGIALALAAMGIYGVMAHTVAQQRREIGIRMALGAAQTTVVGMITRSGMGLAAIGLAVGTPFAILMYWGVASALNLFDADLGLMYPVAIGGALVLAAVTATYLPARRASSVSPVAALRDD